MQTNEEKFEEAKRLFDSKQSKTRGDAASKVGLTLANYYYYAKKAREKARKLAAPIAPVKKKTPPAKPAAAFIDIPLHSAPSMGVAVVICQPHQLKSVLAGIQ